MSRKKVTINPICGQRLKEAISETSYTQKDFAERVLFCTPEHLSLIITGKRNLQKEIIDKVIKILPYIRYEWLSGIDDFKTEQDFLNYRFSTIDEVEEKEDEIRRLTERLIELHGYTLSEYRSEAGDLKKVIKPPEGLFKRNCPHEMDYHATPKNRGYGTFDNRIVNDINDYIEMRLSALFINHFDAEKGCYGGW